jgi:hypothetical protein
LQLEMNTTNYVLGKSFVRRTISEQMSVKDDSPFKTEVSSRELLKKWCIH